MKNRFPTLKLATLATILSIPLFSTFAFGEEHCIAGIGPECEVVVYLDCNGDGGNRIGYAYDNDKNSAFKDTLKKYGDKSSKYKIVADSNHYLAIHDAERIGNPTYLWDESTNDYLVFDSEKDGDEFCKALAQVCKGTFDTSSSTIVMGSTNNGAWKLGYMYWKPGEKHQTISAAACDNPDHTKEGHIAPDFGKRTKPNPPVPDNQPKTK